MVMKKMPAGKFKAQCLQIMDEVNSTLQPVVITKRGRPVVKLVPVHEKAEDIFGCMKDEIEIVGDILSPATPLEDWEMLP
jgi:prevent-host-death family protein